MPNTVDDARIHAKLQEVKQLYPWYNDLLQALSQGENVGAWSSIPLLTHERLLPYFDQTEQQQEPNWNVYRTSGTSSNRRKAIVYDPDDEAAYVEHKTRLFGELLHDLNATRAISDMGTGHAAATAQEIFEQLGISCVVVPFQQPIDEHLEQITQFRPDVLYTMPSILDALVKAAAPDLNWGIRRIILVGEPASPAWRQRIAERMSIRPNDIVDTYGSIEVGTMAYFDSQIGRYVLMDGLLAEGITPQQAGLNGITLPVGEEILVLTSFVRRRFPVLRYVTYDVVRDLRTELVDGQLQTTFAALVKRIGPELKHGEKISVYDVENAVFRHVQQADVRILVQDNRLRVYIQCVNPLDKHTIEDIRSDIHEAIPEIGDMIRSQLLEEICIIPLNLNDPQHQLRWQILTPSTSVKQKKLYIQP
ncbi:AMP-binding protein [Paenibacillus sp. 481]|uniref:AMP-binding protein n=1 Tax=Paenibacillus sp. 481 TaxID=2835869 RepID=UPI001E5943E7|nr:AMP-binding protein [Paenibacillus sp. 481]UHA73688.1 AMP-binding protein [Paenibacillus sp. 481]